MINEGQRPALYLLPGLMCDKAVWAHQAEHLADLAEIRIPSFRGFDSLTGMARSVIAEAPESFMVAGHSMGGRVALEVMRLAGPRVSRLALLDTGVHPRSEGEKEKRQQSLDIAQNEGIPALARVWAPPMVHPDRHGDDDLMGRIFAMVERHNLGDYSGQINALLNRRDATPQLAEIACPTLVLCGQEDAWSPLAQHEEIAAEIPGAELVVIADAGHMSTMERPEQVTTAMRGWLQQ